MLIDSVNSDTVSQQMEIDEIRYLMQTKLQEYMEAGWGFLVVPAHKNKVPTNRYYTTHKEGEGRHPLYKNEGHLIYTGEKF